MSFEIGGLVSIDSSSLFSEEDTVLVDIDLASVGIDFPVFR